MLITHTDRLWSFETQTQRMSRTRKNMNMNILFYEMTSYLSQTLPWNFQWYIHSLTIVFVHVQTFVKSFHVNVNTPWCLRDSFLDNETDKVHLQFVDVIHLKTKWIREDSVVSDSLQVIFLGSFTEEEKRCLAQTTCSHEVPIDVSGLEFWRQRLFRKQCPLKLSYLYDFLNRH
jgi:hypothetical protein